MQDLLFKSDDPYTEMYLVYFPGRQEEWYKVIAGEGRDRVIRDHLTGKQAYAIVNMQEGRIPDHKAFAMEQVSPGEWTPGQTVTWKPDIYMTPLTEKVVWRGKK